MMLLASAKCMSNQGIQCIRHCTDYYACYII